MKKLMKKALLLLIVLTIIAPTMPIHAKSDIELTILENKNFQGQIRKDFYKRTKKGITAAYQTQKDEKNKTQIIGNQYKAPYGHNVYQVILGEKVYPTSPKIEMTVREYAELKNFETAPEIYDRKIILHDPAWYEKDGARRLPQNWQIIDDADDEHIVIAPKGYYADIEFLNRMFPNKSVDNDITPETPETVTPDKKVRTDDIVLSDLPKTHPLYTTVNKLYQYGHYEKPADGKFRPNEAFPYQEGLKIMGSIFMPNGVKATTVSANIAREQGVPVIEELIWVTGKFWDQKGEKSDTPEIALKRWTKDSVQELKSHLLHKTTICDAFNILRIGFETTGVLRKRTALPVIGTKYEKKPKTTYNDPARPADYDITLNDMVDMNYLPKPKKDLFGIEETVSREVFYKVIGIMFEKTKPSKVQVPWQDIVVTRYGFGRFGRKDFSSDDYLNSQLPGTSLYARYHYLPGYLANGMPDTEKNRHNLMNKITDVIYRYNRVQDFSNSDDQVFTGINGCGAIAQMIPLLTFGKNAPYRYDEYFGANDIKPGDIIIHTHSSISMPTYKESKKEIAMGIYEMGKRNLSGHLFVFVPYGEKGITGVDSSAGLYTGDKIMENWEKENLNEYIKYLQWTGYIGKYSFDPNMDDIKNKFNSASTGESIISADGDYSNVTADEYTKKTSRFYDLFVELKKLSTVKIYK